MLNIALLNKAENIRLASNALHLILVFVTTPIFLHVYKVSEWPLILFLYFRRSYKGTLPSRAREIVGFAGSGPIFES